MNKYLPALLTGFAVTVVISFGLGLLGAVAGHSRDSFGWLPGVIFGLIVALVMANLVGTKRTKAATAAEKAAVLTLQPPSGQAQLIVFREGFVGMAVGMNLTLDARQVAQLKSSRFTALSTPPGRHTLSVGFMGLAATQNRPAEQDFVAEPGEVVAFRIALSMGATKNTIKVERIDDPASLAAKLKTMTMVAPQV
jgi:hypothetical protein